MEKDKKDTTTRCFLCGEEPQEVDWKTDYLKLETALRYAVDDCETLKNRAEKAETAFRRTLEIAEEIISQLCPTDKVNGYSTELDEIKATLPAEST